MATPFEYGYFNYKDERGYYMASDNFVFCKVEGICLIEIYYRDHYGRDKEYKTMGDLNEDKLKNEHVVYGV